MVLLDADVIDRPATDAIALNDAPKNPNETPVS